MTSTRPVPPLTSTPPVPSPPASLEAVKARQQQMWASGDYGQIGTRLQSVGEALCDAVDLRSDERVLDVAAGNGNAALAAARRFADVLATDYVPALLEAARRRADADGLDLRTEVADAERLPYDDGAFDVALSTFGVMFAPDAPRAAAELVRVVRLGGRIGLACWTPEGFVGAMLRTVAGFVPPPTGVEPPTAWGRVERLHELFPSVASLRAERRVYAFRFRSADHFVGAFRAWYGPMRKAYDALDEARRPALTTALHDLLARHDRGGGRGLVVPSDYLEIVVTR